MRPTPTAFGISSGTSSITTTTDLSAHLVEASDDVATRDRPERMETTCSLSNDNDDDDDDDDNDHRNFQNNEFQQQQQQQQHLSNKKRTNRPRRASFSIASPCRDYFSRRSRSRIRTNDLPMEHNAVGIMSPWALLWGCIFLTVPFAYLYILLILLRELCKIFPDSIFIPIQTYVPFLAKIVTLTMQPSSKVVEVWCVVEAIYYVFAKLYIFWLECKDPLEASLSSAPMMELEDRQVLWGRMVETESDDPVGFISGWFFDSSLDSISKYDIRDFLAWSMFEGRNLEHLTSEEMQQLERFLVDLEYRISLHLYGEEEDHDDDDVLDDQVDSIPDQGDSPPASPLRSGRPTLSAKLECDPDGGDKPGLVVKTNHATKEGQREKRPKQIFRFMEETNDTQPNFFSNLYESYKIRYEQYRTMVENTEFHPVQDFRNFMAEKAQQLVEAEETAMATATHMYENAYHSLVSPGSQMDKQLTAIGRATQVQLTEAWNSVLEMRERLETAQFLSSQRKMIRQQLKGYRAMLNRMRAMSSGVPSKQMAVLMRRITACNEAMEHLELRAREAFVQATGFARKNLMLNYKDPQRFAKYSSDPLLGIATYPLGFHLLLVGATEIPLRIWMHRQGFQRLVVGPVRYYFHPGRPRREDLNDDEEEDEKTPLIFVHGIGIGLISYMPLIHRFLQSGRPIFLPEIPYVCGFRPWQSPNAVLAPAVVASAMTAMLASHGYLRGTFVGHSYGTSWLSYMCKYASQAVAGLVFLDPICFCLHVPRLTKQFVYHRPDPGSISYIIRTDMMVNWTIQRSFPWAWIVLFVEQMSVPSLVFLSDKDALVPAQKVETYLRSKGAPVWDFDQVNRDVFRRPDDLLTVCVFRGDGHGGWTERPHATCPMIAEAIEGLGARVDVTE